MKDKNGDEWFYDEANNSVKAFCPNCNFIEFVKDYYPQEDYEVYPKPKRILKEVEC